MNIQAKSSDVMAGSRRASGVAVATLVVDSARGLLIEANAPARRALGLRRPLRTPVALDAAMPALQALRRLVRKSGLSGEVQLTFWSAAGVHHWRCRYARPWRRGALKSRFFLSVLPVELPAEVLRATEADGRNSPVQQTISVAAIARLAHELRTPVSAIFSAADVMAEGHLGAVQHERYQSYIVGIRDTARHLLGVVESMLMSPASAVELQGTGGAQDAHSNDLNATVGEVVHGLGALAETKGIALAVGLAPRVPAVVADRTGLRQMIYNLLSNALRHAGQGARVTARTGCEPCGAVWLEVEDDGPGIPQVIIERTFQTASPDGPSGCPGTGLGLVLTRKLAESAGATLSLVSASPGARARITFRGGEGRRRA